LFCAGACADGAGAQIAEIKGAAEGFTAGRVTIMPLKVNIRRLETGEARLRGELPVAELGLDCPDELVHARQPVRYDLTAQKAGQDVLVQGRVGFVLDCECARCLKAFKQRVEWEHWTALVPLAGPEKAEIKDDGVDLTPYLREDILLEFPQHPLCETDCAGLPNRADENAKQTKGASQTPDASVWSALNKLKF
jgi:uncharacterized metal-binding protein YceD (DUF177 family)